MSDRTLRINLTSASLHRLCGVIEVFRTERASSGLYLQQPLPAIPDSGHQERRHVHFPAGAFLPRKPKPVTDLCRVFQGD